MRGFILLLLANLGGGSSITQPQNLVVKINGVVVGSGSSLNLVPGSGVVLIASPAVQSGQIDLQLDLNTAVPK